MALAYQDSVPLSYRTQFINKVIEISNRLNIDPNWLMIVMRFESAGSFSPSVKNKYSGAVGLIQFTTVSTVDLGVTLAQLAAMDAVTQLNYVEKYLSRYKGKLTDIYQVYLAVFSPAYLGRPDAQKVYVSPSKSYEGNKALDTNGDGIITVGEIKSVIKRYIPAGFDNVAPSSSELPIIALAAGGIILYTLFR